jgi:hypothetical protein
MSVYIYVLKSNKKPITKDELKGAVSKQPRYSLTDKGLLQVPCGNGNSVWLELTRGALLFQMLPGHEKHGQAILDAIRRFAGCIRGAVVDGDGDVFEPLPCDDEPLDGADKPKRRKRAQSRKRSPKKRPSK